MVVVIGAAGKYNWYGIACDLICKRGGCGGGGGGRGNEARVVADNVGKYKRFGVSYDFTPWLNSMSGGNCGGVGCGGGADVVVVAGNAGK